MAARKPNRFTQSSIPALANLLSGGIPTSDAPHAALIRRFAEQGRRADRDQLFKLYAPWVQIIARRMKSRAGGFFRGDLDDMIQDGCIGLLDAIDGYYADSRMAFYTWTWRVIRRRIRRGEHNRSWGHEGGNADRDAIRQVRAGLIRQHGRMPYADEITAELRKIFPRRDFQVGNEPFIDTLAGDSAKGQPDYDPADCREASPDARAIDGETIRLALKGLKPQDKMIFRLLLKGVSDVEIAKRLGVSRARVGQRTNGILWEARSRADLAAYLGVQPETLPAGCKPGNAPSIAKFPPARRAVSA